MPEDFAVRQWEKYEGGDWWSWAVWIEGRDDVLDRIDYVEWILHSTFVNPVRKSHDRKSKFRLETGGWGVFPIVARVQLKNGQSAKLRHRLSLHYPDGKENEE